MSDGIFYGTIEHVFKIIVIGDPAVGKTELLIKSGIKFDERPAGLSTVGLNIGRKSITIGNKTISLLIWDVAGQPQFYMLHRPYFNGADGIILAFDITRSSTFSNLNTWWQTCIKYGLGGIPRILVGIKKKINSEQNRKIVLPMAEHLSEKLNAPYYEASLDTGENIDQIFHKIAELVYRAKNLNYTWNKKPLIFKAYEGPTQPSSSVSDSTKKEDDMTREISFLKKKKKAQTSSQPIEQNKREKRALKTTFRYFNESKAGYFKPEKSQTELLSAIERRELLVLTSKFKFQKVASLFGGFFYIWIIVGLSIGMIPWMYTRNPATIVFITLIIVISRVIIITMYLRHYFIVLDSHGIYYKKIRGPRFIPWTDVVAIIGYLDYHFFLGLHSPQNERTVGLDLKSKKKVQFNAFNYNFKGKYSEFDDAFITFKFRQCNFYRYGLLAYKNRVEIFKP